MAAITVQPSLDLLNDAAFKRLCLNLSSENCNCSLFFVPSCTANYSSTLSTCEDEVSHHYAYTYLYPILLILCLFGNGCNIAIYSDESFHNTQTMKFFIGKGMANITLMLLMGTNFLKAISASEYVSWFFWYSYPFILCLSTTAQFISVWLTLLLTIEMTLSILLPIDVRVICQDKVVNSSIIVIIFGTALIQVYHLLALKIVPARIGHETQFRLEVKDGFQIYEKAYFWVESLGMIIPFFIMVVICCALSWYFHRKTGSYLRQTALKVCIIRLALATMLSHLVFESVQTYLTLRSALIGSALRSNSECIVSTIGNFLSLTNASWTFYLYFAVNKRFRQMFFDLMAARFPPSNFRRSPVDEMPLPLNAKRRTEDYIEEKIEDFDNLTSL